MSKIDLPSDLTDGEKAILKRLERKPLELYWGRSGWCAEYLPKPAKRADFDRIYRRHPQIVTVQAARLILAEQAV